MDDFMRKSFLFITLLISVNNLWAYGIGYATFPLMTEKHLLSGEFNGIVSEGGGVGLQARYSSKLNTSMMFDAGFGVAGGERNARYFAGLDYEIIPDYLKQPRISGKVMFENAKEFGVSRNILSLAPTLSKGFNVRGHELFPFVAIPLGLNLDSGQNSYQTFANLSVGVSGKLPFKNYSHLTGNIEAQINLKDSYTGFTVGLSYTVD